MKYSFTLFKNVFDNKTHKSQSFKDWDAFETLLYTLSKTPGEKTGPNAVPLISPAIYEEGETRRNVNVKEWAGWCALDVDDYEGNMDDFLSSIPYYFVCYSTASSTKEKPKFRLVFPLTGPVLSDDIKHFWHSLNKTCLDIGDAQTKDLSRMYFIPAIYPDAYNFIFTHEGPYINPQELMNKYPRLNKDSWMTSELEEQLAIYKREQLNNTDFYWTSYRDCPFWPKELALEYRTIGETGWYHHMYKMMVRIAGNAIYKKYPIRVDEIVTLVREFDKETGDWYKNRPLDVEATRALDFVLSSRQ